MKFFLLQLFAMLCTVVAGSQVKFGLMGGPQASSARYMVRGVKQETEHKFGFQLGGGLKVPFEHRLNFAPSLFYSLKGYKVTFTQFVFPPAFDATNNNTTIHTVETAFLLEYEFSEQPGHAFLKFGPSLDFQLFGKEEFRKTNGTVIRRDIHWSYSEYGRYAANFLLHLGYESPSGFMIFGQYTHGLASINNADDGPKIKHRAYGLSIGKYLHRK